MTMNKIGKFWYFVIEVINAVSFILAGMIIASFKYGLVDSYVRWIAAEVICLIMGCVSFYFLKEMKVGEDLDLDLEED